MVDFAAMTAEMGTVFVGDCLERLRDLPDGSVNTCVTSPPYFGLRDYGADGQIGLEATPTEYVAKLVAVFREVRRVLRDDGTLWLNLGDSYAGSWGNQGRKESRGTQRPVNGGMIRNVHDGRYPSTESRTGSLRPVEIHREFMTAAARWIMALKLWSVLSARMAMRLNSLSLQKKFSMRWRQV